MRENRDNSHAVIVVVVVYIGFSYRGFIVLSEFFPTTTDHSDKQCKKNRYDHRFYEAYTRILAWKVHGIRDRVRSARKAFVRTNENKTGDRLVIETLKCSNRVASSMFPTKKRKGRCAGKWVKMRPVENIIYTAIISTENQFFNKLGHYGWE